MTQRGMGFVSKVIANIRSRMKFEHRDAFVVGRDHLGNKYCEQPADPSRGVRKAKRWYRPPHEDGWEDSIPPEWEAWLRYRRDTVPTEQEVLDNLKILESRRMRGQDIEAKFAAARKEGQANITQEDGSKYKKYAEYHQNPGNEDTRKK